VTDTEVCVDPETFGPRVRVVRAPPASVNDNTIYAIFPDDFETENSERL
jgi:hypothetical protein